MYELWYRSCKVGDLLTYTVGIMQVKVAYMRQVIDIDIFVNCNWVVTRWQKYSTHLHTKNT